MEPKALTGKLHSEAEKIRREFIITEIDTAFTFARSAETLYVAGSPNAARISGKAWEAYSEAASQLTTLAIEHKQRAELNYKLEQIRVVLDRLPSNEKLGLRVVGRSRKG